MELEQFKEIGLRFKPDMVILMYFINDAEPIPTYPRESWLDLHSAAWIVLNYRIDSLIRTFGPRPDWKHYYRNLYDDNATGWQQTQKAIAGFAETSRSMGAKLVVFHLPELRELKPYPFHDVTAKVKKVVEANGLRFVDLLPTVEGMDPASLWVTVPDPHPNGKADTAFTDGMLRELTPMLDELCRTGEPGVYAIGDLTGPPWLAHKASHEGVLCVEAIAGMHVHPMDILNIPGCTYCRPQVASVGLTEAAAKQKGHEVKVGRFPFIGNGKAIAMGEPEGMIKTVFDARTGELLGAHMAGPEVTEMIQGYTIAKTMETTEAELMETVFPHPTISEAMHESVLDAYGRVIHI